MFELIIILSRYLFIIYILYFLWQSLIYLFGEETLDKKTLNLALSKQRITIVFFHLTAFLILSYRETLFLFDRTKLITGTGGLVFLLYAMLFSGRIFKEGCPLLWNAMLFLMDLGFVMLMRLNMLLSQKQLIWAFTGFSAILFLPLLFKILPETKKYTVFFAAVTGLLLLLPLLLGAREYGALSWIRIGAISVQPSEIAKLFFIFYLSCVFFKKNSVPELVTAAAVCAGFLIILIMQKDLGAALIFFLTFMFMFYIAYGNAFLFLSGIGCASLASCFLYKALDLIKASTTLYKAFDHVKTRVDIWLDPFQSPSGDGYQIIQSFFAMGTWGLLGSGLTRGYPQSIPIVTKDFIFAAVCEEFGSIFALGIIFIYIIIIFKGLNISNLCPNPFYSLIAAGITVSFALQAFLIIGGVIKFIPVTGVTLPFVCYGGTSMCVNTAMIGLLQWVACYEAIHGGNDAVADIEGEDLKYE